MANKIQFGLIWLGFVAYAFFLAPPEQSDTFTLIQKLASGQWEGINPLIIALFNIMGLYPAIYACVLFADGRGQKIPAWIFVVLSFGVGAFALLPYFGLRSPNPSFSGKRDWLIKVTESRITGVVLTVGALILVSYGFKFGDWSDFLMQWRTSRFINVMSLDFCLLSLMFAWILGDDMVRRGLDERHNIFMAIAAIPLLGPLIYLCSRPPLVTQDEQLEEA